jgi:hypothetical protein
MALLQDALVRGKLVVFVGAGCSMAPPTSLPSWWEVNGAVIAAVAGEAAKLLPNAQMLG